MTNWNAVALIEVMEETTDIPTCFNSLLSPYGDPQSSFPEAHSTAEYNLKITNVKKKKEKSIGCQIKRSEF